MKYSLAILLMSAFALTCIHAGQGQRHVKDMDKEDLLTEILTRFFLNKGGIRPMADLGFATFMLKHHTTSAGRPIPFTGVDRNEGNGYDSSTGVFVAPVGGLYHFYWRILSYKGENMAYDLKLNGAVKIRSYIPKENNSHENTSGAIYMRIKKGDKVWLSASGNGGFVHDNRYSTFGGELIRF